MPSRRLSTIALLLLVPIIIASLSVRKILAYPGILFFNEVGIPPFPALQKLNMKYLYSWSKYDFGSIIVRQYSMWTRILQILTGTLGFNDVITIVLFISLNMVVAFISMYLLLKTVNVSDFSAFVGSLFYVLNPYLFHEIVYGHIPDAIFAYAFFPLLYVMLLRSYRKRRLSLLMLCSIISAFATSTIFSLVFALVVPSMYLIIVESGKYREKLAFVLLYTLMTLVPHAPWILSSLQSLTIEKLVASFSWGFERSRYLSAEPYQAWINTGYVVVDFAEKVGTELLGGLWYASAFSSTLIAIAPSILLKSINKYLIRARTFFLTILTLSIGMMFIYRTEYGSAIYELLRLLPGFTTLFRSPTRFAYVHALSSSALIGLSLEAIQYRAKYLRRRHIIVPSIYFLALLIIFIVGIPFLTGDFGSYFRPYDYSHYSEVIQFILSDSAKCEAVRALVYPPDNHVRYDPQNDLWKIERIHWSTDPILTLFPVPTLNVRLDSRFLPTYILIVYLLEVLRARDASFIEDLLNCLNIKYVLIRHDVETPINVFSALKLNATEIERKLLESRYFNLALNASGKAILFVSNGTYPRFVIPKSAVLSDIRDLNDILMIKEGKVFLYPILLSIDNKNHLISILKYEEILIRDLTGNSLILSFSPPSRIILPAHYIKEVDPTKYFIPYVIESSWYKAPSLARFAYTWSVVGMTKNATLNIPLSIEQKDNYYIAINAMSVRNGSIELRIAQQTYVLQINDGIPKWYIIGPLQLETGKYSLDIINAEGVNAINFIIVLSDDELKNSIDIVKAYAQHAKLHYALLTGAEPLLNKSWDINILKDGFFNLNCRLTTRRPVKLYVAVNGSTLTEVDFDENFGDTFALNIMFNSTGLYRLELGAVQSNLVKNPSFEDGFSYWHVSPSKKEYFTLALDPENVIEGKYSLMVITNVTSKNNWSFIRSEPVNVIPGETLLIVTHIKGKNVVQSHIAIEGYFKDLNQWKQLAQAPKGLDGTFEWQESKILLTVPENVSMIRVVLNAGWVKDQEAGPAITWFDDIKIIPVPTISECSLKNYSGNQSTQDNVHQIEPSNKIVYYKELNPTSYIVKIKAQNPFILMLLETYHPLWWAETAHSKYDSIPVFGLFNGFVINEVGDLTIVIKYLPQDLFNVGLGISIMTFTLSIFSIIYEWGRSRKYKILSTMIGIRFKK